MANTSDDWEPGIPTRHIDDVIESHRERARGERVADNIENTLNLAYVPDFLRDHVATGPTGLGYQTDDYVSIDKRNFASRVEEGAPVIVSFGSYSKRDQQRLVAEGVVVEVGDTKRDDMIVEISDENVEVKGWQINGVLKPDAKEHAHERRH